VSLSITFVRTYPAINKYLLPLIYLAGFSFAFHANKRELKALFINHLFDNIVLYVAPTLLVTFIVVILLAFIVKGILRKGN
jgi:hypothetical protein